MECITLYHFLHSHCTSMCPNESDLVPERCCCHSSTCTFPPKDPITLIGCGTFGANGCSIYFQSTCALCIFCISDRSEVLLGSEIIYRVLLLDWALTSFFHFLVWRIALQIHLAILGELWEFDMFVRLTFLWGDIIQMEADRSF
jgi:hypothetical protein